MPKNVLLLHGTRGSPRENWFPWLKEQVEGQGWKVWVPDLPDADHPVAQKSIDYVFANKDWQFNEESVMVGHSSGAVTTLGLIQELPEGVKIKRAIMVGVFRGDLGREDLKDLVQKEWDLEKIKARCQEFIFIHSDNDPYCPLEHAKWWTEQLNGKLVVFPGRGHFSIRTIGENARKIPEILEYIR